MQGISAVRHGNSVGRSSATWLGLRRGALGALTLFLTVFIGGPCWAEGKQVALVVGNAAYAQKPLRNALNDSTDLAAALRASGFQVLERTNRTADELRRDLADFQDQLAPGVTGLFYFAGPGVQGAKGQNYLLPVGVEYRRERDAELYGLDVGSVLQRMEESGASLNLVILDACRDSPLPPEGRSVSSRGLARMEAPSGSLIAFATAPGFVADDNTSGRNGPYTKYLLEAIRTPGLRLEDVFKRVRRGVEGESNRRQSPEEISKLTSDEPFYFLAGSAAARPGPTAVPTPSAAAVDAAAAATAATAAHDAVASAWPGKSVGLIVPFPPGGATDFLARLLVANWAEKLDRGFVVQNQVGAGGAIGIVAAKAAAADGYTALLSSQYALAVSPQLTRAAFDPLTDFDYVSVAVRMPYLLAVAASSPHKNWQDLQQQLRRNPGQMRFGSSGKGSSGHLTTELFWQRTSTRGQHVAYKGTAPLIVDILGGQAEAAFVEYASVAELLRTGKLRALAIAGAKRLPALSSVPTFAESGIADMQSYSSYVVAFPKGVRPGIVDSLKVADIRSRLLEQGFEIIASTPQQARAYMAAEFQRWQKVIEVGKITVD